MNPYDQDRPIGRPAQQRTTRDVIHRVRIGDTVFTGTGTRVRRYRDHNNRLIVEIELIDGISI